jgi:hypothetical protein
MEALKTVKMPEDGQKPVESIMGEFGTIGYITDMLTYLQDEVLDRRDIALDQLIQMTKCDGQARGILNAIKYPVKMARPAVKEVEGGAEEAKFIRENLLSPPASGGMDTPIQTVISRMALAVRDGYKVFEKVWEPKDGKIRLKRLAYRSTLCTNFTYDTHGVIKGAKQLTSFNNVLYDVEWDKDKIAYFIYNAEENPYKGESDFYPVFYHYDKKHKLYAIAHLAYQLNACPIRIGTHPANMGKEELEKFRNALKSLGTTVVMTFPNTCAVDKFESDRKLTEFLGLIQHHDGMMSRVFLTQFMNLGQEGRGGSYALSSDQSDLFLMSLMSLLFDIADVFNVQVIPQLIDWNFGTDKYPKLVFTPFSDTIRTAIMDTFKTILAARFPQVTPEMVLELEKKVAEELGLEIDYKAVQARIDKERADLQKATDTTSNAPPDKNATVGKNVTPNAAMNDKKLSAFTTKRGSEEESDEELAV